MRAASPFGSGKTELKDENVCRERNPEVEVFGPTTRGYGTRKGVQLCRWSPEG
jgi:hypothetical protein